MSGSDDLSSSRAVRQEHFGSGYFSRRDVWLQWPVAYTAVVRSSGVFMNDAGAVLVSRTVALISGQYIVREGLQKMFEDTAETCRIVVQLYQQVPHGSLLATNPPDLFLLDLATERDPIGSITKMREAAPNSKIVVMSGVEHMDRTDHALGYGVDGVILNVDPPAVVLAVIKTLYSPTQNLPIRARNETECRDLRKTVLEQPVLEPQRLVWTDTLTQREQEVGRLVSQGLSNKEIARQMSIADSTVRHHLTNVFAKVGVPNRKKLLLRIQHDRCLAVQPDSW